MRAMLMLGLCLMLLVVGPAWAGNANATAKPGTAASAFDPTTAKPVSGNETTASRVFSTASPSVVVVKAFDADGNAITQGSGVVIAKGVVISNCHVFAEDGANSAAVFYENKRYAAKLRYGDPEHDLCSFTVAGLAAPPVTMRNAASLKIGESAYAIGAPEGFKLSLSNGIISSLRQLPDSRGTVIQMTTPISPGSSGGGLFDSQGRLIGITSYYWSKGQQLNFALPVDWIRSLPQRGKTLKQLASEQVGPSAPSSTAVDWSQYNIVGVATAEQYADAIVRLTRSGQISNAHGHFLVVKYRAEHPVQGRSATQAQYNLGLMYAKGNGVAQDYSQAIYWYRKAAARGDAAAQNNLGWMYDYGHGVERNYIKAATWYRKAATQGFDEAQFNLGQMYLKGHGVSQDYAQAMQWLRRAAQQGVANAQVSLGVAYALGLGGSKDYVQAGKWATLASAGGGRNSAKVLSGIESKMTAGQIAEAQRLAREWLAKHHKRSAQQ